MRSTDLFSLIMVIVCCWTFFASAETDKDKRSLVIVFDTTDSMADDLEQLKPAAAQIINEMAAKQKNPIYNYVFAPFNDPSVGPILDTSDPKKLLRALDRVSVVGGGDCPEMALTGIKAGLEKARPKSFVYIFTDADAKDEDLYESVLQLSRALSISLTFIVAEDSCSQEPPPFKAYKKLVDDTNGQLLMIKSADTKKVVEDMSKEMDVGATILNVKHFDAGNNSIVIPVDDNLKYFTVTVSGGAPEVVVKNPKNEVSNKAKVGLDMDNVVTIHVNDPEPGLWTIETNSNTPHIVKVSGISDITFDYGFSLHSPVSLDKTQLNPTKGFGNYISIAPSDALGLVTVEEAHLFSATVDIVVPLHPVSSNRLFVGAFDCPETNFKVEIKGKDASGNVFKRYLPTIIIPEKAGPPHYTGHPLDQYITVNEGESVQLDCVMQGDPKPQIKWFKNGVSISATTDTLQVNQAEAADYYCTGSNDKGAVNVTFHVNKFYAPRVIKSLLRYENGSIVMFDKDSVNFLNCPVEGQPLPTISWFKDNTPVNQNSKSVVISSNGLNLQFLDIAKAPAEVMGNYKCVAKNKVGEVSLAFTIGLNMPPAFRDPQAEEKYLDKNKDIYFQTISIKDDEKVTLNCDLVGYPKPVIQWFKQLNFVLDSRELVQKDVTQMTISASDDDSVIICTGDNANGRVEKHFKIEVKRSEIPKTTVYVAPQGFVTLNCRDLSKDNNNSIKWYKHGNPLPESPHYKLLDEVFAMKIVKAGVDQVDSYNCAVEHSNPSKEMKFDVRLIEITKWTEWSKWSSCNCDSFQQFRSRQCVFENGSVVPQSNKGKCSGEHFEGRQCEC